MKKCRFLILTILFSIFLCIPILAESPDDGHLVAISVFDSNGKTFHDVLLMDEGCYSVYFEDSDSYTVVSASSGKGTFYSSFDINNKPSYMSHFDLNNKFSLDGAYSASYDVWYTANSGMHFRGYTIQQEYFDLKFASKQEFFDELAKYDSFESFVKEQGLNSSYNDGRLPLLSFKINQAFTVADVGGSVKYKISWSAAQHDIYADNPNKYKIELVASSDLEVKEGVGSPTVVTHDIKFINDNCKDIIDNNIPIYQESYSFLDKVVTDNLLKTLGSQYIRFDSGVYYFLFIRIIEPGTDNVSVWKVYKCQGRIVTPYHIVYDEDGKAYEMDESDKDDSEPDTDMGYDSDPSTDASKSESSSQYNDGTGLSAVALLNSLKDVVNTLGELPDLFQKVFLWMPNWLIVLICVSIGSLVVIGVVKMLT